MKGVLTMRLEDITAEKVNEFIDYNDIKFLKASKLYVREENIIILMSTTLTGEDLSEGTFTLNYDGHFQVSSLPVPSLLANPGELNIAKKWPEIMSKELEILLDSRFPITQ